MASLFQRHQKWWIKFRNPQTGKCVRASLETGDPARAQLLCQRINLEVALLEPKFQMAPIPSTLVQELQRDGVCPVEPIVVLSPAPAGNPLPPTHLLAQVRPRAAMDEAISAYLKYIHAENDSHHAANKVSMMRRLVGSARLELLGVAPRSSRGTKGVVQVIPPFFKGGYLDELTPTVLQSFVENLDVSKSTMRHYREFLHHFFEVALKFDLFQPSNWHRPNPAAALPSYSSKNKPITYLTKEQVDTQLAALGSDSGFQAAVAIMIHAGLRRAELLWLTKDSFAPDLSFMSIINRLDDNDEASSLKTGERTVTILPPLRPILEKYIPTLKTRWVIPNTEGGRWDKDNFSKRLRGLNSAAELPWTCLTYRHTYATQRAAEGWSLFRISKEMGNSSEIVERHYAAFIRPET